MIIAPAVPARELNSVQLSVDYAVIGGGMAGVCSAITAARAGLKVVLVQDRPVLGGNASSEVRLWLLGATTHMGSNNRWAREGGVANEIILENLWRNPEGNPLIFDTILLEKTVLESNLTLLLNTACYEVEKNSANPDRIAAVNAFCSQNSTRYHIAAPLFCDASGDGIIGFLAGAAFRMGAESKEEFGERFAPTGDFGHLLGHSIYFYTKDTGQPVKFIPPSFALTNIEQKIPRYQSFTLAEQGCKLWWIEWGGRLDTVHDTEQIKWELWKVAYGVWGYIKNSGHFPESENYTLEWVGHIPGKRESRRFEGDYILRQQDIVERRCHPDAVAYGGWSIDLHPADGVYAAIAGSHHLHSKGIYQIPYRCYYSRNIENLFLSGRLISASHVAFGSIRVMMTCALGGQAVAHAAALCLENNVLPRDINQPAHMTELQRRLLRTGQYIPNINVPDPNDLAQRATVTASSTLRLAELPLGEASQELQPLTKRRAQMLPLPSGPVPAMTFYADVAADTSVCVELRTTSDPWHHTPDVVLDSQTVALRVGSQQPIPLHFQAVLLHPGYVFVCFEENPAVSLHTSPQRVSGLLQSNFYRVEDCLAVGGEKYDIYTPGRRPGGHNLACQISRPIDLFRPENILNGWLRPTHQPNAWVASPDDPNPVLTLTWPQPQKIRTVQISFDPDYDHSMESVLYRHPERAVVFCVKHYQVLDNNGRVLVDVDNHHQAMAVHTFPAPVETTSLTIRILETWGAPAALFEVRCMAG